MNRNESMQSLFGNFLQLRSLFDQQLENLAESMDMNRSELLVVLDVMEHPDTSLNDLCIRCGLKKSAASKLIDRLENRNFIERIQCPSNRREIQLTLGTAFQQQSFCRNQALSVVFPGTKEYTVDRLISIRELLGKVQSELFDE